jgi:general secretion pathway protein G
MERKMLRTRRDAAKRAAQRGMTLIEIMIVILIMAMIATGVSIAVTQRLEAARESDARVGACVINNALVNYMAEHPRKCPTLEDLVGPYLDKNKGTKDPWDEDYVIDCTDIKEPFAYSKGADDGGEPIKCEKKKEE